MGVLHEWSLSHIVTFAHRGSRCGWGQKEWAGAAAKTKRRFIGSFVKSRAKKTFSALTQPILEGKRGEWGTGRGPMHLWRLQNLGIFIITKSPCHPHKSANYWTFICFLGNPYPWSIGFSRGGRTRSNGKCSKKVAMMDKDLNGNWSNGKCPNWK